MSGKRVGMLVIGNRGRDMIVHYVKASGSMVILLALLVSLAVPIGPSATSKAQAQPFADDFEDEEDLCVCGVAFYKAEMDRVIAEIAASREAGDDAADYYQLIREWTTLRGEAETLTRWCHVVPLHLDPDYVPLTCPGDLQD